ncbi:prolipoprotein diacylglyceryl transferase [Salicola sp. Rm-C-2C1-2]|uniref:prolipoprotein diacylglyceryl transferase n=1 Tax=Salicola sp. Rm-C-2C1-2 TaxID=3141321 RepID=UPI0032E46EC4
MLVHPQFDPVAVSLGPVAIHWYGLTYLVAFVGGWALARSRTSRADSPVNAEQLGDLLFYMALGVILGGRFGYVLFYHFDRFLGDPFWLVQIWEGGMSFHGGLIGVLVAMLMFARRIDTRFFNIADFIAPVIPVGLGLGRLGNFINGELWGRPTSPELPWAMVFPQAGDALPRHPSQLYQFALEGVLLFVVLWWFSARPRPRMAVSGLFLAGYGILRSVAEFYREPDAHLGFVLLDWMTMGQVLSAPMIVAGGMLLFLAYQQGRPA